MWTGGKQALNLNFGSTDPIGPSSVKTLVLILRRKQNNAGTIVAELSDMFSLHPLQVEKGTKKGEHA